MSRPLVPPRRVLVSVASLLAAIGLVRAGLLQMVAGAVVDHAVCNIITLILGFSALVSLLLWFLRESGHEPRLKRAVGYGLLAAVWTENGSRQTRVAKAVKAGQLFINCYGAGGGVELPFGGTKRSGHGREKGLLALEEMSTTKTVIQYHG